MNRLETLRTAGRNTLLAELQARLAADPRIAVVWLHGSLGQGTADAWSDIDLWVLVYDTDYDDRIRHEFAGETLFREEAPQNAPPGGAYLMTAHDAPSGPHLVDWYFQPLRYATAASEGRKYLFERAAPPPQPEIPLDGPRWTLSQDEDAANVVALFWAMILIQAKYIARTPVEDGMGFEGFLISLLRNVARWKGVTIDETETARLRYAAEKLDRLRSLGEQMAGIAGEFAGPQGAVFAFLKTVQEHREGG